MSRVQLICRAALLLALLSSPAAAAAQAGGAEFLPAEVEAMQMAQEMSFVCNPERHRSMAGSESVIRRASDTLAGTAALLQSAEGTFLVLEGYDENMAGHCLVLAWFGNTLEAGRYAIRQLSSAAMEEETSSGAHSFFTFSAVRAPGESSILVTQSGSLEILTRTTAGLSGTFRLTGFAVEGGERTDGIVFEGSFTALEREP